MLNMLQIQGALSPSKIEKVFRGDWEILKFHGWPNHRAQPQRKLLLSCPLQLSISFMLYQALPWF